MFKCWLNCQLASIETLLSLEKSHQQSNAIVERGPFLSLVVENDFRQRWLTFYVLRIILEKHVPSKNSGGHGTVHLFMKDGGSAEAPLWLGR